MTLQRVLKEKGELNGAKKKSFNDNFNVVTGPLSNGAHFMPGLPEKITRGRNYINHFLVYVTIAISINRPLL